MRLTCAHEPCSKLFEPNTHNQKYCSSECCKAATNAKIMKRYYERKSRLKGTARKCYTCGAGLSRYNDSTICSGCAAKQEARDNVTVLSALLAMNGG